MAHIVLSRDLKHNPNATVIDIYFVFIPSAKVQKSYENSFLKRSKISESHSEIPILISKFIKKSLYMMNLHSQSNESLAEMKIKSF